ncbi:MAG: helix-turn-helix transcriptional regulator [Victivallales bacterium]|nr:helix-turn-helix transcriptional regulator [Victivallales bacterium]
MNLRKKNITGKRIKEIRLQLGLSQDQLSGRLAKRRITIDRAGISKIEIGLRGVYDFELKAFSKILKVSADWLLEG